jgi:Superinfection immunity protein
MGIALIALVYFVPTFIAFSRGRYRHGRPGRVFLINLLTGWTVIGWFAALLYCAMGEKLSERQHRELVDAVKGTRT